MNFLSRWLLRRINRRRDEARCAMWDAEIEEAKRRDQAEVEQRELEQRRRLHALRNAANVYLIRHHKES